DCLLGVYQPLDYASTSSLDIPISISSATGEPLPVSYVDSFTMSYLIRQFVFPVLRAAKAMQSAHAALMRNGYLRMHADSMYMMSQEDASASPFELKSAELRGDSIARRFFDEAALADNERIVSVSLSLYKHLVLNGALAQTGVSVLRDSVKSCVIDSPYGRVYIGSAGRDEYRGDYLLILDVGGDDRYVCSQTMESASARALRVIVDLSGDDEYTGTSYSLGAGIFGGNLLVDMSGNDLYKAGSFSLGAGLFGAGAVYDGSGNDIYVAGTFAQGAGAFGVGLLVDGDGNDAYTVQAYGQAFGGTRGAGFLVDKAGNDIYSAVSPFVDVLRYDEHYVSFTQGASLGHRPIAGGGFGILVDSKGNDTYTCDIYGQGSSYWFGYAALIDEAGEDRYKAYQYAQGAGIHFAHGLLLDRKGDDVYVSHGVSQGCGHDVGVGILVDENGNDSYVAESLSLGGGNANAISIFTDVKGDDAYIARSASNCFGYSDFRRSYGMIGIFADGEGKDLHGETGRNATTAVKSTYGVFLDVPDDSVPNAVRTPSPAEPSGRRYPPAASLDSLFVQACTAPQKYQYMVQPARDSIVRRTDALPFLARYLGSVQPRERLAMENMMPALYARDTLGVTSLVKDSLASRVLSTVQFCLWLAGKCAMTGAASSILPCLQHTDWRVRAVAAQNIGEGRFDELVPRCAPLLKDTVSHVRMRAAYTIASRTPRAVTDVLKPAMNDPAQLVRNAVGMGLRSVPSLPFSVLRDAIDIHSLPHARRSLVRALPAIDTAASRDSVADVIMSMEPEEREAAYRAVRDQRSDLWIDVRDRCRERESDAAVRNELGPRERSALIAPLTGEKVDTKRAKKRKPKRKERTKAIVPVPSETPIVAPPSPTPARDLGPKSDTSPASGLTTEPAAERRPDSASKAKTKARPKAKPIAPPKAKPIAPPKAKPTAPPKPTS
ncbi:MAG: HEAT repeat domain-containing protein, partial [Candidatus Kapaibacterium sp.]